MFVIFEVEFIVLNDDIIHIRDVIKNKIDVMEQKQKYSKNEWSTIRRHEYLKILVDI